MDRRLEVRLHGADAGTLVLKENGNMQFRYNEGYAGPPISVALPVRSEAYSHHDCLAWFGGLLPEGDVRTALARALGTSPSNQFRILGEIGGDCAGAVELVPADLRRANALEPLTLSEAEFDEVIRALPRRPLGANPGEGIRMSLAGAQPKLPAIFEPTRIAQSGFALPRGSGPPTTHLVKPEPEAFPGMVDNEFFCMTLARNVGMDVALTDSIETKSGEDCLVVRRYDRHADDEGVVRRVHQEDFCQALLVRPEDKYQEDGGPSFASVASLLRRESRAPIDDLNRLWEAAIFNWAIGNCDAHAKNFSLLHDGTAPRLAPLYDLVSTVVYPELSARWAMTIGGARSVGEVSTKSWETLAREMNLAPRAALERAKNLLERVKVLSDQMIAMERFRNAPAEAIAERIRQLEI
ncbi:MAG: type II toxin-antitoxin system HipA family toxin [Solirubrobacterales bacterium]